MPGKYLDRFFDDLEARLAQFAGIDLKVKRVGTIDREVLHGSDWDKRLSGSLSTDKALVTILTPLYFTRPNCGKEVYAFVIRAPSLGIDTDGALTNLDNILPIRWLREEAYYSNTQKDFLTPPFLRRVSDMPSDDGKDAARSEAIERYRKKGMEDCVTSEPHYRELLDLIVLRILGMPPLPPTVGISFGTAQDAFCYDWSQHFAASARAPSDPVPPIVPIAPYEPRALASVVVFYVTKRAFTPDSNPGDFADQLIAEPFPGTPVVTDPELAALLADVRGAGIAERLTVFHAASSPSVPVKADPLVARLAVLSQKRVLTALIVDPSIWPTPSGDKTAAAAIEKTIRSPAWTGAVFLPNFDPGERAIDLNALAVARDLPSRLVALPRASDRRLATLRRAFVDSRGQVLRGSADHAPGAEPIPLLGGVGAERG